jgi:hypothetical protein
MKLMGKLTLDLDENRDGNKWMIIDHESVEREPKREIKMNIIKNDMCKKSMMVYII